MACSFSFLSSLLSKVWWNNCLPAFRNLAVPKICSHCNEAGHNSRGCPKLHPGKLQAQILQAEEKARTAQPTCSICGKKGHNRWQCRRFKYQRQQAKRGPLWGIPGVEEHRLPGNPHRVFAWPMPLTPEGALQQVQPCTLMCFCCLLFTADKALQRVCACTDWCC